MSRSSGAKSFSEISAGELEKLIHALLRESGTGLTMTVPLFNRNQGNRVKAASVVSQSGYELQAGLIELRAEIEQVVQLLRTARENASSVSQEELRLAAHVRDSIGEDEFVRMREARDKTLELPRLIIPSIQVNIRGGNLPEPDSAGKRHLKVPINEL